MKPFHCSFIPFCVFLMLALGCTNQRGGGAGHYISKIHPSRSADTVAVSMRVLIEQAQSGRFGKDATNLGGIGWLEGYVIDPESRDIILVGKRVAGWPSLHLDDLAVSLRNEWHHLGQAYCSLDPRPQDVVRLNQIASQGGADYISRMKEIWGPQTVRVGGVPRNSHDAHVMIDADYHMKKLSQGLETMDGVSSCMDLALQAATLAIQSGKPPSASASMSRFWFHFGRSEPTFKESEGIVMIDRCAVAVLTEKQRAASDGTLADSGGDDPYARLFAQQLTERYQHAAMKVREYAELENLFRLSAVAGAMRFEDADAKAGLDMGYLLNGYAYRSETPMPPSLPGLVNSKETSVGRYILMPVVCGGVSREIQLSPAKFTRGESTRLQQFRVAVLRSRHSVGSVCWRVGSSL